MGGVHGAVHMVQSVDGAAGGGLHAPRARVILE